MLLLLGLLGWFTASLADAAERLVFSRLTGAYWQIWVMDIASGEAHQLTFEPGDKKKPVGLDGGRILYLDNHSQLWLADPAHERPQQIWPGLQVESAAPGFIPNELIFSVYEPSGQDISHIWRGHLQGHQRIKLTRGAELHRTPDIVPGSYKVVYTAAASRRDSRLVVRDLKTEASETLIQDGFQNIAPAVSPDGHWMAYASNRTGDYEIWIRDFETHAVRQLTHSPGLDTDPRWASQGRAIVFVSARTGNSGIWRIAVDTAVAAPLTAPGEPAKDPWVIAKTARGEQP